MVSEHLTKENESAGLCGTCGLPHKGLTGYNHNFVPRHLSSNEQTLVERLRDCVKVTFSAGLHGVESDCRQAADELDRQRAEIERLTRERDHFQACWNAVSDIRADRDRLMKLLEIERGVVLTRGQALTRALRCFDELLDNVWPNGLPSTVDAVV